MTTGILISVVVGATLAVLIKLPRMLNEREARKKAEHEYRFGYVRVEDEYGTRYMVARDENGNPTGEFYNKLLLTKGPLKVC